MKYRKLTEGIALSTSEWEQLIDDRLFSERDRYIMKRLLLDDAKYELISEEVGLSTRYTKHKETQEAATQQAEVTRVT